MRKENEEDEQILAELSSAHPSSQINIVSVSTNQLQHVVKIVIINRDNSIRGRILTTAFGLYSGPRSKSILPYRPPARLIRAQ